MVDVHVVGRAVPRVVRAAVHVEQQRPWPLARGVADQPGLDLGAVGDGERPLLTDEQLDVAEHRPVLGQHGLGAGREVDGHDLAVRRGCRERHHGGAGGDRESGDHTALAGDHGTRGVPQVGAPTVPDAEQEPAVGGLDRQRAGVGRAARHHVAVQVADEVDGSAAVERDAHQVGVPEPQGRVADDEQARAVGGERDRAGDAVLEGDGARERLRVVGVEQVHRGAERQVTVVADLAGEGEGPAVRGPGGPLGVVAVGDLSQVAGRQVQHVQLVADRTEHAGAVGLVVHPAGDQGAFARRVHGCGEREVSAAGAPHRGAGTERQLGDLVGLTPVGGEQVHLALADEREPGAVGRPRGGGVAATGGQPACGTAGRGHGPQLVDVAVRVPVEGAEHVDHAAAVGRQRRLGRDREVGQVVDVHPSGHGVLLGLGLELGVEPGTAASSSRV